MCIYYSYGGVVSFLSNIKSVLRNFVHSVRHYSNFVFSVYSNNKFQTNTNVCLSVRTSFGLIVSLFVIPLTDVSDDRIVPFVMNVSNRFSFIKTALLPLFNCVRVLLSVCLPVYL